MNVTEYRDRLLNLIEGFRVNYPDELIHNYLLNYQPPSFTDYGGSTKTAPAKEDFGFESYFQSWVTSARLAFPDEVVFGVLYEVRNLFAVHIGLPDRVDNVLDNVENTVPPDVFDKVRQSARLGQGIGSDGRQVGKTHPSDFYRG